MHWLYWGDTAALESSLNRGLVEWQGLVKNVHYLGLDDGIKRLLGRWWRRWIKTDEGRARGRGKGARDLDDEDEEDELEQQEKAKARDANADADADDGYSSIDGDTDGDGHESRHGSKSVYGPDDRFGNQDMDVETAEPTRTLYSGRYRRVERDDGGVSSLMKAL